MLVAAACGFGWASPARDLKAESCATPPQHPRMTRFCEVDPEVLWRGARPDREAAAWLLDNGVHTVINLEMSSDDLEAFDGAAVTAAGKLDATYVRVQNWEPLPLFAASEQDEHVVLFLSAVRQAVSEKRTPVYVHCRSGQNRTGVMIAAYKVVEQNQDADSVIKDFQAYRGFWARADERYIRSLAERRNEIRQRVERSAAPRPKARIVCESGRCNVIDLRS
jgi:protein tyrosine/serine phosphatase